MNHQSWNRPKRVVRIFFVVIFLALFIFPVPQLQGAGKKPPVNRQPPPKKPIAPPPPKSSLLTEQDWQRAPLKPLQEGEIDKLIQKDLDQNKVSPAHLTTDEQFIRRATLDLTGELPAPADVKEFI